MEEITNREQYMDKYKCKKCKTTFNTLISYTWKRGCSFSVRETDKNAGVYFCPNEKCEMCNILVVVPNFEYKGE